MAHEDLTVSRPLEGIRVLEMGQLMAGPFAGTILGYYGAEVIKIEPPGAGDPVRVWRVMEDGTSLWWASLGRNKKCVTLDLRKEEGRDLARRLAAKCDVVIENFRPGTMEKWGLGPDDAEEDEPGRDLRARLGLRPDRALLRASRATPRCARGSAAFRYVNGFPDRPPVRPNLSLGDTLAGLHAAFGIVLALYNRDRRGSAARRGPDRGRGHLRGRLQHDGERCCPEYDRLGVVREREGAQAQRASCPPTPTAAATAST